MFKLFIMMALMLVNQAYAADLFTPNADDWVIKILGNIFGSALYPNGGVSALSTMMQTFNEGVILLGGVYATYTLLSGILGTAHEGSMLGKNISSVYMPIRYALATSMIIPIVNGFCVAQVIVAWLSIQGNGLADSMWKSYTSTQNSAVIAVAGEEFPSVKTFVWNAYQTYGCYYAHKQSLEVADPIIYNNSPKTVMGKTTESNADGIKYSFGDPTGQFLSIDSCGTIYMPYVKVPTISLSNTADKALIINFDSATALNDQIKSAEIAAFNTAISQIETLASNTVSTGKPIDPALLNIIIKNYQTTIASLSSSVVQSIKGLDSLSQNAQKGGWITSYTYFMQYAYLHDQISTALHNLPVADGPKNTVNEEQGGFFVQNIRPVLETVTNAGEVPAMSGSSKPIGEGGNGLFSSVSEFFNKLKPTEMMKKVFLDTMIKFEAKDGEFPMYTMTRMGDTMLMTATGGIGAAGLALFTIGAHPGIAAFVQVLITIVLTPMLLTALMLKWFLPFLPFIIGVGVLGGIVLGTSVSILVAPIWILGHLNPHADSMIGSSGNGYRVMLAMTLRPALTTMGVAISFLAILEIGKYINSMMAIALALSQSGTGFFTVLLNFIGAPIMYGILIYKLIMNTLPFSHKIADEVLNVVGGGGFSPGSYADAISHSDNHGAAAGAVAGLAAGAAGALGARKLGGEGDKPIKDKDDPKGGGAGAKAKWDKFEQMNEKEQNTPKFSGDQIDKSDLAKIVSGNAPLIMSPSQQSVSDRMEGMKDTLGKSSQDKFDSAIEKSINNPEHKDYSDQEHMDYAYKVGLNNEFGAGAGSLIKGTSKDGFNSPEAKAMVSQFQKAKSEFQAASPYATEKEILNQLSKATAEAKSAFVHDKGSARNLEGGKTIDQFVSDSFEKHLNLGSNSDFSSTPIEAPVQETPSEPAQMDLNLGEGHESQGNIPSEAPAVEEQAPFSDTAQGRFDFDSNNVNQIKDN